MALTFSTEQARQNAIDCLPFNPDLAKRTYAYQLADEVDRLRAALAFYAHTQNYVVRGWQGDPDSPAVVKDGGAKARETLEISSN